MRPTLTLLLLTACTREEPVPDDLVDPVVGLFRDLQEPSADSWAGAIVDRLLAYDPASPDDERTWSTDALAGAVSLAEGAPVAAAPGRALAWYSQHDLDDHRRGAAEVDQACAQGDPVSTWTRTFAFPCWGAGSCRDALADSDVVVSPLPDTTLVLHEEFVELELVDEVEVHVSRRWLAAPGAQDDERVDAWQGLTLWTPDPEDLRRTWVLGATWIDGTTLSLPSTVDGWHASRADRLDAILGGESPCTEG